MKKTLAMFLALAMMLTCFAMPAALAEESTKLVWWTLIPQDAPIDAQKVLDAANAYSQEKIGITVDLQFKTSDQLKLDLNTGEYYDLIFTCEWDNKFDLNAQDGLYYDITDLVKKETPALYDAIDPYWVAGSLDERILGIPTLKDIAVEVFFRMNTDYFEGEKGMTVPDSMAFADLAPYLEAWKADHPNEYPLHMTKSGLSGFANGMERIVSSYLVIPFSAAGTENGTKVIPLWESEEYMDMLRLLHTWYEAGYINPDAATNESLPMELRTPVRSGTAWKGYKGWSNPETYGFNVKLVQYIGPYMSRATMQGSLVAVNAAAKEENAIAALKYMELLYTDTKFRDILGYGLEGEHFNYLENGTVLRTETGTNNYSMDLYVTGPAVSASILSGSETVLGDPNQWKLVYDGYKEATVSDTQGFAFNGESTADLRTALYAVYQNYMAELVTGTSNPDEAMKKMADEMYAIGLQQVIDEAQGQLDAYLASR
jgi:Domain of unknown function (DUF3502).